MNASLMSKVTCLADAPFAVPVSATAMNDQRLVPLRARVSTSVGEGPWLPTRDSASDLASSHSRRRRALRTCRACGERHALHRSVIGRLNTISPRFRVGSNGSCRSILLGPAISGQPPSVAESTPRGAAVQRAPSLARPTRSQRLLRRRLHRERTVSVAARASAFALVAGRGRPLRPRRAQERHATGLRRQRGRTADGGCSFRAAAARLLRCDSPHNHRKFTHFKVSQELTLSGCQVRALGVE